MKQKLLAIFLLFVIMLLTILRENLAVEINALIDGKEFNKAYFYVFSEFLSELSNKQLYLFKWVITFSTIFLVSSISVLTINLIFGKNIAKQYAIIYVYVYVGFLLLIALFRLLNVFESCYFLLRKILGVLQSPIPLFVAYTTFWFKQNKNLVVGNKKEEKKTT